MKNRNFRRKVADHDGEEEANLGMPPASVLAARKEREREKKQAKKSSLLSFEDDEGEGSSAVKVAKDRKPAAKVKPTSLKGLSLTSDVAAVPSSTQRSGAGEYTADKLKELKKQARSYTGPRASSSGPESKEDPAVQPAFKLAGSFKPAAAANDDRFQPLQRGTAAASSSAAQDGGMLPPPSRPKLVAAAAGGQDSLADTLAEVAPVPEEEDDKDYFIPNADLIRMAKEKRERLRSAHLAPDYIPLGGASGLANLQARLKPNSQAEPAAEAAPSGSDSGEEGDQDRMTFVGTQKGKGARQGVLKSMAQEPQAHGEDEEDDDHWVQEQIRKGVGGGATAPAAAPQRAGAYGADAWAPSRPMTNSQGGADGATLAGQLALQTLEKSLTRLQTTEKNIAKQASKTAESMQDSVAAVARLEKDLEAASSKYTFLQQLRAFVADLCDMLQAKSAIVEELEEHLLSLGEQRASARQQRAAADETFRMEPASAAVSATLGVLSRSGALPAATAAAESAAEAVEDRLAGGGSAVQLDEFGRDINVMARSEAARRKARLERSYARWQDDPETKGGAETSDESDSEEGQYTRGRAQVLETAASVFADADEQYGDLTAVKRRLEAWKRDQPGPYRDAYVSLSAPAIFAPFVRNELLSWDPVFQDAQAFDEQPWYHQLYDYGSKEGENGNTAHVVDEDEELIPKLVADLVFPRAIHALQVCWNPYSRRQTKRAVRLLDHLLVFLPAEHAKTQEVIAEVKQRLEGAAADLKLPAWPAGATAAAPRAALLQAHLFGKAVRLLANIAAFDAVLGRGTLLSLALERLLQLQVLPYLHSAAGNMDTVLTRCERVVAALPDAWFQVGPPPASKPFVELLHRLARPLEAQRKDRVVGNTAAARRLARILAKVGDRDRSKALSQAYPA